MKWILKILIRGYQKLISPLFPSVCRFQPSCSAYAIEAIDRFGAVKGVYLAARRIWRCRPGGDHGYDPVPKTFKIFKKR